MQSRIFKNIPEQTLRRWTKSAKYCLSIGCNCSKCEILTGMECLTKDNCCMKAVVYNLIKRGVTLGLEDGGDNENNYENQEFI